MYSRRPLSVMSETERIAKWVCPLPRGEGGPRPALSPAGAGRVKGQLHAEDGSERLGASCSIDTSNASSFWRGAPLFGRRRISAVCPRLLSARDNCSPAAAGSPARKHGGLRMTDDSNFAIRVQLSQRVETGRMRPGKRGDVRFSSKPKRAANSYSPSFKSSFSQPPTGIFPSALL